MIVRNLPQILTSYYKMKIYFILPTDKKCTRFISKVLLHKFNKAQIFKVPSINMSAPAALCCFRRPWIHTVLLEFASMHLT